jgi:hypothetical protein
LDRYAFLISASPLRIRSSISVSRNSIIRQRRPSRRRWRYRRMRSAAAVRVAGCADDAGGNIISIHVRDSGYLYTEIARQRSCISSAVSASGMGDGELPPKPKLMLQSAGQATNRSGPRHWLLPLPQLSSAVAMSEPTLWGGFIYRRRRTLRPKIWTFLLRRYRSASCPRTSHRRCARTSRPRRYRHCHLVHRS